MPSQHRDNLGGGALHLVTLVEHILAVLPDAAPPASVIEDLERRVGGAFQQVAHAVPAGVGERQVRCGMRGNVDRCVIGLRCGVGGVDR